MTSDAPAVPESTPTDDAVTAGPQIVITYCTQCRWILRATWLASELLTTFSTDLAGVTLQPGTGGIFRVAIDDEVVWDRKADGGFPDTGPLKRMVRDRIDPERSLGHTDRAAEARTLRP